MSSSPESIGSALQSLFRQLGMTKRIQQFDVLNSWESIVGEKIASVTTPRRIVNGVLFVDVKTASWRNELALRKNQILEKVRQHAGKKLVRDIRFH
ncbi:MAG: DUF721 domain-containing protein [Ignavibacteria bacterium]|nr:DUF721 domain-containing protein [Ignavibacteria bacterium]